MTDLAAGEFASGAWGLRLIESDVAASATAFSPLSDSESTDWMTWRGFTLENRVADVTVYQMNLKVEQFIIRNPRKTDVDMDFKLLFEVGGSATSAVEFNLWARTGLALA